MPKTKHLHIYKRVKMGKDKDYIVYACQRPDCSHYISPTLLVGKMAACCKCREPFLVSSSMVVNGKNQLVNLHCKACTGVSNVHKARGISPKLSEKVSPESLLEALGLRAED